MTNTAPISIVPDSSVPLKEGMQGMDGMGSKKPHSLLSVPGHLGMHGNDWERLGTDGKKRPPSMARKGDPK